MMNLAAGQQAFFEVHITAMRDPHSLATQYAVAQAMCVCVALQVDVTDAMLAEQRVAALQGQQEALLQQMLPSQVSAPDLANAPEPEPEPGPEADVPDLPGALEQPPHDPFPHPTSCTSATPQPAQTPGLETMLSLDRLSLDGLPQLTRRDVMELATMHEEVSILFTDIQNFTAMSQQLHPGQVMLFLNHIFSLFDDLLEDHDCYKVETIGHSSSGHHLLSPIRCMFSAALQSLSTHPPGCGAGIASAALPLPLDCYMVCAGLFDRSERTSGNGLPAKNSGTLGGHDPAHAQKLLSFGKAMVRTASRVTDPLGEPVQMRVGLHCRPVMSGVVGRRIPRFCLFGDTVNTASRMQSTGQVGRIHVSQAFMSHLPHETWQETQGVEVKGKGWMQTAFLADIDA
ncbi:hypothetical protein QJQ45_027807 [Haematococcus lacustris]|nr:hypothetical protein QJQ45_027807 [Haematococcus lacustris]